MRTAQTRLLDALEGADRAGPGGAAVWGGRGALTRQASIGYAEFVSALIQEVFSGLRDASARQLDSYRQLVSAVARVGDLPSSATSSAISPPVSTSVLAQLLLLGLQRVVVTDGRIDARVVIFEDERERRAARSELLVETPEVRADRASARLASRTTGSVGVEFHTEVFPLERVAGLHGVRRLMALSPVRRSS